MRIEEVRYVKMATGSNFVTLSWLPMLYTFVSLDNFRKKGAV